MVWLQVKGVIIAQTIDEAKETVKDMLSGNRFGDGGHRVVIEEFMLGEEASFYCLVDGKDSAALCVFHRITRPATMVTRVQIPGGMGAYSPLLL